MSKDILTLAREAGFVEYEIEDYTTSGYDIRYERLAELVRADAIAAEREACSRVKAAKPRKLKPVGRGMLLDEQQFCFDKGWREGAASVRAAIRARGSNT